MNWTKVSDSLPAKGEVVLIWIRFRGERKFRWSTSYVVDSIGYYIEPNTGKCWAMGYNEGYVITHWMKIEKP